MSILTKIRELIEINATDGEVLYNKWSAKFRDEHFQKIYWDCFPFMDKYYFEANPSYFYEYNDMFDFGRYPIVMLRDGFLGILDLFILHRQPPKDFNSIVLIHKKYECLIPKQWSDNVALYEITNRQDLVDTECKKLVVYANPVSELFWEKSSYSIFDDYFEQMKNYEQIYCLFPDRKVPLVKRGVESYMYYSELSKVAMKKFPDKVQFHFDFKNLIELLKRKKISFLNLDQTKIFNADNYLDHLFYSGGGYNIAGVESSTKGEFLEYNLSNSHKIKITLADTSQSQFKKFYFFYKASSGNKTSIYQLADNDEIQSLYQETFKS